MSAAPGAPAGARARRRWSLQTRLIVTVVSFVALILIAVGLATGAALRSIVSEGLDSKINAAASEVPFKPEMTASALLADRPQDGALLIVQSFSGLSGAYVGDDDRVVALSPDEISTIVDSVQKTGYATLPVLDLGEYRVMAKSLGGYGFVIFGLPATEQTAQIAQILTTVALLTSGGLLVLAAIIAFVIGRSLRPLHVVAETAARVAAQPLASGDVTITERVPLAEADPTDEIGAVGAALNTLLDHVDQSLAARQRNEERMRAFVADASHELRTPLAAIRGYSELSLKSLAQDAASGRDSGGIGGRAPAGAESAGADSGSGSTGLGASAAGSGSHSVGGEAGIRSVLADEDAADASRRAARAEQTRQALERIQAASLRMTTLVEDLLLLARLDEGKELVYGSVDLSRVVVDAVTDAQIAGPDHEWVIDVPEEPVVVAGDAGRLHQVIANLLTNARVHTPAGVQVTATVSIDEGDAVVRIADDGPGIDPAVAGELFERFARADASRARQTGGTGLGLSIAKAIVTAHQGSIGVQSTPGSTVFEVRLPARPAAPAVVAAPTAS